MQDVADPLAGESSAVDIDTVRRMSQRFRRAGIVTVTELFEPEVIASVTEDALYLLDEFSERRDLRLATTGNTRRSMSVVPSEIIGANGRVIPLLYRSDDLVRRLQEITRETMHPCPLVDEEFLISRHEKQGDTHGWHWGDFAFALIWVLQAPPVEVGGLLQCVPHTDWDKADSRVNSYLCANPIDTYHFESGEVYLLRSDTTLHRTTPLIEDATRIMLNMTWASDRDLARQVVGNDRWWDDPAASAVIAYDAEPRPIEGARP